MISPPERLHQLLAAQSALSETRFTRRDLLLGAGSAGLAAIASRPSFGLTKSSRPQATTIRFLDRRFV
jgi:hypothetical protein